MSIQDFFTSISNLFRKPHIERYIEVSAGEEKSHFRRLPDEIVKQIFYQLVAIQFTGSFADWNSIAVVCHRWSKLMKDVQKEACKTIAHKLMKEAQKKWESHFGEIGEIPALPDHIAQILRNRCPFWPNKRVYETHLLTLIPKTVNGNLLTLEYIGQLIQSPKQGHKTKFDNPYFNNYEKTLVNQSHWVLMTREVIPKSQNSVYSYQLELVKSYNQKSRASYEMVHLIDAVVAILLEHVQTGTRLYSNKPCTCTKCQEEGKRGLMVVGGFSQSGLHVNYDYVYDHSYYGLSVFRKF